MPPSPYEIYDAVVRLGKADYARPCVIMTVTSGGKISAFPISSAPELYRGPTFHFWISATEPDFSKTGLKKDSYVMGDEVVDFESCDLIRKRGRFDGALLARYRKWIG